MQVQRRGADHDPSLESTFSFCDECKIKLTSTADDLMLCGRCRMQQYCSANCQRKHWKKEHRAQCEELRELRRKCDEYREYYKNNVYRREEWEKYMGHPTKICNLGVYLYERQRYQDAVSLYEDGIHFFRDEGCTAELYLGLSMSLACSRRRQAYKGLQKLDHPLMRRIDNSGLETKLRHHLASTLQSQGDYESALTQIDVIIPNEPLDTGWLECKGKVLALLGQFDRVDAYYRATFFTKDFERTHLNENPMTVASMCFCFAEDLLLQKQNSIRDHGLPAQDSLTSTERNEADRLLLAFFGELFRRTNESSHILLFNISSFVRALR